MAAGVVGKLDKAKPIVQKLVGGCELFSKKHISAMRRLRGQTVNDSFKVIRSNGPGRLWQGLVAILSWPGHAIMHRMVYRKVKAALGLGHKGKLNSNESEAVKFGALDLYFSGMAV